MWFVVVYQLFIVNTIVTRLVMEMVLFVPVNSRLSLFATKEKKKKNDFTGCTVLYRFNASISRLGMVV